MNYSILVYELYRYSFVRWGFMADRPMYLMMNPVYIYIIIIIMSCRQHGYP